MHQIPEGIPNGNRIGAIVRLSKDGSSEERELKHRAEFVEILYGWINRRLLRPKSSMGVDGCETGHRCFLCSSV